MARHWFSYLVFALGLAALATTRAGAGGTPVAIGSEGQPVAADSCCDTRDTDHKAFIRLVPVARAIVAEADLSDIVGEIDVGPFQRCLSRSGHG
jgi:hypothetical protein